MSEAALVLTSRFQSDSINRGAHQDDHRIVIKSFEEEDVESPSAQSHPLHESQAPTTTNEEGSHLETRHQLISSTSGPWSQHARKAYETVQSSCAMSALFILSHPLTFLIPLLVLAAGLALSICAAQNDWLASKAALEGVLISLAFLVALLVLIIMHMNSRVSSAKLNVIEEEKKLHALISRQYQLLELIGIERDASIAKREIEPSASDQIDAVRNSLQKQIQSERSRLPEIHITQEIGSGSFGRVFLGIWQGSLVAVKRILLPAALGNRTRAEKMAIMEAAISSSMSHPHLVQTFTYSITLSEAGTSCVSQCPPEDEQELSLDCNIINPSAAANSAENMYAAPALQIQLVLEYCDRGSLREALDEGLFMDAKGMNYQAMLETAADIARGMIHLHSHNVLHSDLKAANVMLKTGGGDGRGLIAKVADFGMSLRLSDESPTLISDVFQGTVTHMAPEALTDGKHSKAADVYSFGILLWELFTGGSNPYPGSHKSQLIQKVAMLKKRPALPRIAPKEYRKLSEECWHHDPALRPSFEAILETLKMLIAHGPTSRRLKRTAMARQVSSRAGSSVRASFPSLQALTLANISEEGSDHSGQFAAKGLLSSLNHIDRSLSASPMPTSPAPMRMSSGVSDITPHDLSFTGHETVSPSDSPAFNSPFSSAALLPLPPPSSQPPNVPGHSPSRDSIVASAVRVTSSLSLSSSGSHGVDSVISQSRSLGPAESFSPMSSRNPSGDLPPAIVGPNPLNLPPRLLATWSRMAATSTMETIKETDSEVMTDASNSTGIHSLSNASSMQPASSLSKRLSSMLGDTSNHSSRSGLALSSNEVHSAEKDGSRKRPKANSGPLMTTPSFDSANNEPLSGSKLAAARALGKGRVRRSQTSVFQQPLPVLQEEGGEGGEESNTLLSPKEKASSRVSFNAPLREPDEGGKSRKPAWIIGSSDDEDLELEL